MAKVIAAKRTKSAKSRHFGVFLLKQEITEAERAIQNPASLVPHQIPSLGATLYVRAPNKKPAAWLSLFTPHLNLGPDFKNANTAAILLLGLDSRILALTFGYGRNLLVPGCWDEDFGLHVALNLCGNSYNTVRRQGFDAISQRSQIQANTAAGIEAFGLDVERDLLQAVVGNPSNFALGTKLLGADSLQVSAHIELQDLRELLQGYLDAYRSPLPSNFEWINRIRHLTDKEVLADLNRELLQRLRERRLEHVWLVIPEIIDFVNLKGFTFKGAAGGDPDQALRLAPLLDSLRPGTEISIELLKRRQVQAHSAETDAIFRSWTVFECIHAEIERDGDHVFLLSEGRWYKVAHDFCQEIVQYYRQIPIIDLGLPPYRSTDSGEGQFNARVAAEQPGRWQLLDCKLEHKSTPGKIEFCDLYSCSGDMVHVKRYGSASRLSHLFAQGLVAGKLFRNHADFRQKVNEKLSGPWAINPDVQPASGAYRVVFAVISDSDKPLDLPFFSKVVLRSVHAELKGLGYNVALAKIQAPPRKLQLSAAAGIP
ncbi:MAG TPA: DUF6119 family protein [Terriglobales bacterium]|nr:DUF6119 family protein [Terriglobales bacterium]